MNPRTFHQPSSENGQALILILLAIVALLGMTALAVDGAMVYADRRAAQNVADTASLGGAGMASLYLENHHIYYQNWNCASNVQAALAEAETTAITRAGTNQFTIDTDMSDNNGVDATCGSAAVSGGAWHNRYIDVTTRITQDTQTSFVHFVYGGPVRNTVEAVTRIYPRQSAAYGYAIVALNPTGCSGQTNGAGFHGNEATNVDGGGIFSNGCLQGDGTPEVNVTNGSIFYHETDNLSKLSDFSPAPSTTAAVIPEDAYTIPTPDCTDPNAHNVSDLNGTLDAGLYCISGDLRINAGDTVIGDGVTIFVPNGDVTINGGATVQLKAYPSNPGVDVSPAIPGVVLYVPGFKANGQPKDVQLNGNSDSYFQGSILAPGSDLDITGCASTIGYRSQFIGWNVEVGGTAGVNIFYDNDENLEKPTTLELYK